ncbi:Hypothetical predicted protein [Paramuricea clavata]|uniref:Uncharacterized protein n=1 Tax=Paramuricea clavata TaxID=317549 RepID=A0A7D9ID35_PARCT|nr:Hypothetical predicted protein [Paramuricea clavata]
MSEEESRPSTSGSPIENEVNPSDLANTSVANSDQEVTTSNTTCCCDLSTRKFASLAYVAFVFISAVIFLVAAKVDTDKKGTPISAPSVYRYLTVVLFIGILWMATTIIGSFKCCLHAARQGWLAGHIEPVKELLPTRLLVGVMFFGLGSSFLTMVELLEYVAEYNCPHKDLTMLFYYIVRTIFIYTQLYFFYKLSGKSEKLLIYSHFLMMHLIAVNLGTWIVTFVYDSAEELNNEVEEDEILINQTTIHNSTILFMARHWGALISTHNISLVPCYKTVKALKSTAKQMEPYLYTFTMEYCLISAGLLLNAWLSLRSSAQTTDQNGNERVEEGRTGSDGGRTDSDERRGKGSKGQQTSRRGHGSTTQDSDMDTGFITDDSYVLVEKPERMPEVGTLWRFGFIFGLAYIPAFTAIIINLFFSDDVENDRLIYVGMQCFFFLSILIASVFGILQLEKINEGEPESQVDFILLGVALVGVFFLDLLIIVAAICETSESPEIATLLIVTNITELLCSVTFTLFVRKALEHGLPERANEVVTNAAPNIREVVSFLFMLNICFWAMYTFEVKKSTQVVPLVEQFYTEEVWFYLSHFVYPLAVFFHFHGAVCMVLILGHYSISKSRTLSGSAAASMSLSHAAVQHT